jgi:hypothetical protein
MAKWGSLASVGMAGSQPMAPEFPVGLPEKLAKLSETPERELPESSIEVTEAVYLDQDIVPGNWQLAKVTALKSE